MANGKITNFLDNNEDLISQFMLENDPSSPIIELKKEVEEEIKTLDKLKDAKDDRVQLNKIEDLESLFDEDDEEEVSEEENDTKEVEKPKETKAEAKKKDKEEKEEEKEEENQYSFENIINYLAQEGIVDIDENEEIEDNEDGLTKAIQKTINRQVDNYKQTLPSIVQELTDFIEKGGDPKKFMGALSGPVDFTDLDLKSEVDQEILIKEYLKTQDYDSAEIKETIEAYKDSVSLEKQAAIAQRKLTKMADIKRQELVREQEDAIKLKTDNYNNYINNITKVITESKSIAGLEIKDKEKQEFQNFLLKVDKNNTTAYMRAIQNNPIQTQVELAYLKFKNYDFSKVAKAAETQAVKKIKLQLTKSSDRNPRGSTGSNLNDSEESSNSKPSLGAFKNFLR